MEPIKYDLFKDSPLIIEEIRWDFTPKMFVDPSSAPGDKPADLTYGYMLYIDVMRDKPILAIMKMRPMMCKTVAYIVDFPEDKLQTSYQQKDAAAEGMYPMDEELKTWLKKEFNVS